VYWRSLRQSPQPILKPREEEGDGRVRGDIRKGSGDARAHVLGDDDRATTMETASAILAGSTAEISWASSDDRRFQVLESPFRLLWRVKPAFTGR